MSKEEIESLVSEIKEKLLSGKTNSDYQQGVEDAIEYFEIALENNN